jgi:pullulanase/glycogen debranching enzyme
MTIDIKPEYHYAGLWRAQLVQSEGDFLAVVFHDTERWRLVYRFRYYVDNKVFNSDDRKSWYEWRSDRPTAKEDMVKTLNGIIQLGRETGFLKEASFLSCDCDGDAFAKILLHPERPGLHSVRMTKEQFDEYERTGKLPKGGT